MFARTVIVASIIGALLFWQTQSLKAEYHISFNDPYQILVESEPVVEVEPTEPQQLAKIPTISPETMALLETVKFEAPLEEHELKEDIPEPEIDLFENFDLATFLEHHNIQNIDDYITWQHKHLAYQLDASRDQWYGPEETLKRGVGDCEDLAFLHQAVLRHFGYKAEVYASGKGKEAHAFTIFERNGRMNVIDNTDYYKTPAPNLKMLFSMLIAKKGHLYVINLNYTTKEIKVVFVSDKLQSLS